MRTIALEFYWTEDKGWISREFKTGEIVGGELNMESLEKVLEAHGIDPHTVYLTLSVPN